MRWDEVERYIEKDNLPISYKLVSELIMDTDCNPELALKAILKIESIAWRLEMLIAYGYWELAVREVCKARMTNKFEKMLVQRANEAG